MKKIASILLTMALLATAACEPKKRHDDPCRPNPCIVPTVGA